jgi:hypothetical protein
MPIETQPMRVTPLIASLGLVLNLVGCATPHYKPQIQTFGGLVKVKPQDITDCTQWAQLQTKPQEALSSGLLKGAFLGFAVGAAASADRTATLLIGALTGVNAAVSDSEQQMQTLIPKCLKSRGYVVLQ